MNYSIITYEEKYKDMAINLILDIQKKEGIDVGLAKQPDLNSISEFYQKNKGNFWLAIKDNSVLGTIGLISLNNEIGVIRKMFVNEKYRGVGLSHDLIQTLISYAKTKGLKEIYLGTIDIYKAAQKFYLKEGFQQIKKESLPEIFPLMTVDNVFFTIKI